jgi:hypothetical protein
MGSPEYTKASQSRCERFLLRQPTYSVKGVGILISAGPDGTRFGSFNAEIRMRFTTNAIAILECALSVFVGNPATAQAPATERPLQMGARVRVSSSAPGFSGPPRVASVLAQHGDTLSLRPEGTQDSIPLPLGSITGLEVSAGRSSHRRQGMGFGLLSGALIGAVVGAATYTPCTSTEFLGCLGAPASRGGQAELGGFAGALIGTFVGGLIGARQTENWERVAVTASKVSVRIAPSGKGGLLVSATF